MEQTAVDWLVDNIHYLHSTKWDDIVEQAKAMEKEQIMYAYWDGGHDVPTHPSTAEDYYNKTFNTKER